MVELALHHIYGDGHHISIGSNITAMWIVVVALAPASRLLITVKPKVSVSSECKTVLAEFNNTANINNRPSQTESPNALMVTSRF